MDNKLRTELLSNTPNPLETIYLACKQCYSVTAVSMEDETLSSDVIRIIKNAINAGHLSVLEHVSFTFVISNVSRTLTHQLVRSRIASFSQASQRYIRKDFEYITPPSIAENPEALSLYTTTLDHIDKVYTKLQELCPQEDARFILPNATKTNIVMTMNCRALLHFFEERCCTKAQWEIRALADNLLDLVQNVLPVVFTSAGAKCRRLGYCPETKSCGKYPQHQKQS